MGIERDIEILAEDVAELREENRLQAEKIEWLIARFRTEYSEHVEKLEEEQAEREREQDRRSAERYAARMAHAADLARREKEERAWVLAQEAEDDWEGPQALVKAREELKTSMEKTNG